MYITAQLFDREYFIRAIEFVKLDMIIEPVPDYWSRIITQELKRKAHHLHEYPDASDWKITPVVHKSKFSGFSLVDGTGRILHTTAI